MSHDDFPFHLSDENRERLTAVRALARDVLAPIAQEGETGRVNRPLLKALGEHGVLPGIFPRDLGGTSEGGASAVTLCLLREGLAGGSTAAETAFALQGLGSYPILNAGNDDLRKRWIPPVATGEAVAGFALTEAKGGSDSAHLDLRAEKDRDGYRLSGQKKWISNAPDADVYTVFARTTLETGSRGITAFVVPGDTPGVGGERLDLVAPHAIGTVEFDGAFIPADHVIGEVDRGFAVAMKTLDLFRSSVGAFAVGMAQAALDAAIEHAGTRESFGRPLRELQAISQQLAEAAARTKAARLLVYDAAALYDAGERVTKASAIAKLYATETAQFVVDTAVQIHGAQGLERGHLLEHLYRDVRATRIYEGTSEIQREVIARELYRE
ncbi:MAG TPA: acyl-CoA dehydrogenase family protein [Actinomycetota bacterium]|nr:acyl-CoA dehydrogenase family protein [Actinomycetota bacterium]